MGIRTANALVAPSLPPAERELRTLLDIPPSPPSSWSSLAPSPFPRVPSPDTHLATSSLCPLDSRGTKQRDSTLGRPGSCIHRDHPKSSKPLDPSSWTRRQGVHHFTNVDPYVHGTNAPANLINRYCPRVFARSDHLRDCEQFVRDFFQKLEGCDLFHLGELVNRTILFIDDFPDFGTFPGVTYRIALRKCCVRAEQLRSETKGDVAANCAAISEYCSSWSFWKIGLEVDLSSFTKHGEEARDILPTVEELSVWLYRGPENFDSKILGAMAEWTAGLRTLIKCSSTTLQTKFLEALNTWCQVPPAICLSSLRSRHSIRYC